MYLSLFSSYIINVFIVVISNGYFSVCCVTKILVMYFLFSCFVLKYVTYLFLSRFYNLTCKLYSYYYIIVFLFFITPNKNFQKYRQDLIFFRSKSKSIMKKNIYINFKFNDAYEHFHFNDASNFFKIQFI